MNIGFSRFSNDAYGVPTFAYGFRNSGQDVSLVRSGGWGAGSKPGLGRPKLDHTLGGGKLGCSRAQGKVCQIRTVYQNERVAAGHLLAAGACGAGAAHKGPPASANGPRNLERAPGKGVGRPGPPGPPTASLRLSPAAGPPAALSKRRGPTSNSLILKDLRVLGRWGGLRCGHRGEGAARLVEGGRSAAGGGGHPPPPPPPVRGPRGPGIDKPGKFFAPKTLECRITGSASLSFL